MSNAAKVIDWNGHDLPPELAALPPGRYAIEAIESVEDWGLTPERITGLEAAVQAHDRGEGIPWETVHDRLRQRLAEVGGRSKTG